MGQEESRLVSDNEPPTTLTERTLAAVAEHIKSGEVQRIVVMTGAGISTAAGIPDFRSPGTGLYANLARLNLPHAEAVFDISYFRQNPDPFYVLARELYPGKFHPTVSHAFIALLAGKGLLRMLFTQNIDCLERRAGVPAEKIVEAHGSFAAQRCIDCKEEFPGDEMREHVEKGQVPRCKGCNGLVKPDIVFFGEALPSEFSQNSYHTTIADLVLVIGTSLSVYPFASLPEMVPRDKPRVLFNMERVGEMGTRPDDVLVLGECDDGIRKLADALGWREELEELWKSIVGPKEAARQKSTSKKHEEEIEEEVAKLTAGVEAALKLEETSETEAKTADATQDTQEKAEEKEDEKDKTVEQAQDDAALKKGEAGGSPDKKQELPTTTESEAVSAAPAAKEAAQPEPSTDEKALSSTENKKSVL